MPIAFVPATPSSALEVALEIAWIACRRYVV
jgi:hypothetical protein